MYNILNKKLKERRYVEAQLVLKMFVNNNLKLLPFFAK